MRVHQMAVSTPNNTGAMGHIWCSGIHTNVNRALNVGPSRSTFSRSNLFVIALYGHARQHVPFDGHGVSSDSLETLCARHGVGRDERDFT